MPQLADTLVAAAMRPADPNNEAMVGLFPSVTKTEEHLLREAGYVPVLRWARVRATGGLSETVVTTTSALSTVRRREKPVRRREKRKRRKARRK